MHRVLAFALLLLASSCARAQSPAPAPVTLAAAAIPAPAAPGLSAADVATETARLRAVLAQQVPGSRLPSAEQQQGWIRRTRAALERAGQRIDRPQLMVVVDRAPNVQAMVVMLAQPEGGAWEVLGGTRVSTGNVGRKYFYITPTGVFPHTEAILGYRAEGTRNENGIRGLGARGMRVWDFGWQMARKGWRGNGDEGEIRLLLHATDPGILEPRIGRRDSQGCVRIPATMNLFLDRNGVLDYETGRAAETDRRFAALLGAQQRTTLAGTLMVVVDSSES